MIDCDTELRPDHKQAFLAKGFVCVRQVVPTLLLHRALRAINHSLGQGRDEADLTRLNATSWCPELGKDPVILDLFNATPVASLAESFLGKGNLKAVGNGQVPPRFPRPPGAKVGKKLHGHIDGLGTGSNGIEVGTYKRSFTGLAVILLSDLPDTYMGNFTVWPGSHTEMQQIFAERGHQILADGMPDCGDAIPAHQCTGKAGDVIFAHHLTRHGAAPNLSPFIRYAAIFRFSHVKCTDIAERAYDDMWLEWEGLHDVLPGAAKSVV